MFVRDFVGKGTIDGLDEPFQKLDKWQERVDGDDGRGGRTWERQMDDVRCVGRWARLNRVFGVEAVHV